MTIIQTVKCIIKASSQPILGLMRDASHVEAQDDGSRGPTQGNKTRKVFARSKTQEEDTATQVFLVTQADMQKHGTAHTARDQRGRPRGRAR